MNTTETTRKGSQGSAKLVSNLLHPWLVLVPVVALAALKSTSEHVECIKWILLTILPAYAFPAMYAKIRASMLSSDRNRQRVSRSLFRNQPREILIMTCFFGIPATLILYYLDGPKIILAIIVAVTVTMLFIALVNLTYRASFHLAMVTSLLSSLWVLFGVVSLSALPLIFILGLSRYRLGEHSPAQLISGFLTGLIITGTVFYGFGLL